MIQHHNINFFVTHRRVEGEANYISQTRKMIQESERLGFNGILFFQNNSNNLEPWVLGQEILSTTKHQSPIIAINPAYIHPYTAAQKIASFTELYKRKIYVNFIIGTSLSDLESIGDTLSHDERYKRLEEYIEIVFALLKNNKPFTFKGTYYTTHNLQLSTTILPEFFPESFIAGGSQQAKNLRQKMQLINLKMGKAIADFKPEQQKIGMYFGIIARETQEEAIAVMKETFKPAYEEYDELLELSMLNTDAEWKKKLLEAKDDPVFKMEPFKFFSADCPYLVGSYEQVEEYISNYISLGVNTFVIDTSIEEMHEIAKTIKLPQSV